LRVASAKILFAHLPEAVRLDAGRWTWRRGFSEYEICRLFRARGRRNANGTHRSSRRRLYRHYRPVLVDAVGFRAVSF